MIYKVVLTQVLSLWMKSSSVTIQMKAIDQYFSVVLFVEQSCKKAVRNLLALHLPPPPPTLGRKRNIQFETVYNAGKSPEW